MRAECSAVQAPGALWSLRDFVPAAVIALPLRLSAARVMHSSWFSGPSNVARIARNVTDGLKRVHGPHAARYEANHGTPVGRLLGLLRRW